MWGKAPDSICTRDRKVLGAIVIIIHQRQQDVWISPNVSERSEGAGAPPQAADICGLGQSV